MISHKKRCIFIHIPKAAGTSIIHFFGDPLPPLGDGPSLPFDPDDELKFMPPPPHLRARDYLIYGKVTPAQFDAYFKFAFVRNPWDRVVSEYKYRLQARKFDFKTWLFRNLPQASWTDQYCHLLPQYDFVHGADGNLMVDFVGRFEMLEEGFVQVCDQLEIPRQPLPRDNLSSSLLSRPHGGWSDTLKALINAFSLKRWRNTFPHYREYYDDESRKMIARMYRKDIKAFGYDF